MTQGDVEVRKLLGLIHARRASINIYLRKIRPVSNRLTNISIIGTAITAALMAGPAFGGVPFAKAVQNGLPFFADSSGVWRMLCFAALIVSVVTAISVNLNKSHNLSSRISTAEACNADLEGLSALIEFGELSVKDGVKVYRQLIAKIPFIEETPVVGDQAYSFDTGAPPADYSRDQATLNRQWISAAFTIMVLAALVLLIAVVGLIAGLGRRTAGSSPPGISAPAIIRVGSHPVWVALVPDGSRAYVTNAGSDSVSVVDLASNTVTKTIRVGTNPVGVAVTPDGRYAYVLNRTSHDVRVIDLASNTVTDRIDVDAGPQGVAMAMGGRIAYVTNTDSNIVSVIDLTTNSVTDRIPVEASPEGVAVTPDGRYLYVPSSVLNDVAVIDTASKTVVTKIRVGTNPRVVAMTRDGHYAYVVNNGSDDVSVIDTSSNAVVTTIWVGASPWGIDVNPKSHQAYVTNRASNRVSMIDIMTNTVAGTIPVGGSSPIWVTVAPSGHHAYVLNYNSDNMSVLNVGS